MTPTVYRLLKGYLARNTALYVFFGLTQFLMTSAYWAFGYQRAPLPGVMLGILGAAAALNFDSLVWRSIPLTPRDAATFRWWATAGLPGLFLTLLAGVDWMTQRSDGLPMPRTTLVLEGILALWAGLGIFAALPPGTAWIGRRRTVNLRPVMLILCSAIVLGYGLPFEFAAQPFSDLFLCVGLGLLLLSGMRALRGDAWRWPDLVGHRPDTRENDASLPSVRRYGGAVVLVPLIRRTAMLAIVAIATISLVRLIFPRATYVLFWVYFIAVHLAGRLMTHKFRTAIQPLRCLPMSTNRLAVCLETIAVLPGAATFVLTLLANRALPWVGINIRGPCYLPL